MTSEKVLRWWPPVGILGMVLLGLIVGKGSTPLDDWFQNVRHTHRWLAYLLYFTDGQAVVLLCALVVGAALVQRRWRAAAVFAVTPAVALASVRILKPLFGREKFGDLAYPSGHVTLTIVVTGMAVLLVGASTWAVVAAVALNTLGLLGQAFTHHYFTDTIGALLLGTSLVCLATWTTELDRCQPHCELHHSSG